MRDLALEIVPGLFAALDARLRAPSRGLALALARKSGANRADWAALERMLERRAVSEIRLGHELGSRLLMPCIRAPRLSLVAVPVATAAWFFSLDVGSALRDVVLHVDDSSRMRADATEARMRELGAVLAARPSLRSVTLVRSRHSGIRVAAFEALVEEAARANGALSVRVRESVPSRIVYKNYY